MLKVCAYLVAAGPRWLIAGGPRRVRWRWSACVSGSHLQFLRVSAINYQSRPRVQATACPTESSVSHHDTPRLLTLLRSGYSDPELCRAVCGAGAPPPIALGGDLHPAGTPRLPRLLLSSGTARRDLGVSTPEPSAHHSTTTTVLRAITCRAASHAAAYSLASVQPCFGSHSTHIPPHTMPDGATTAPQRLPPFAAAQTLNSKFIPSVLIVGAGIGGITLALDLDEAGLTNWIVRAPLGGG